MRNHKLEKILEQKDKNKLVKIDYAPVPDHQVEANATELFQILKQTLV